MESPAESSLSNNCSAFESALPPETMHFLFFGSGRLFIDNRPLYLNSIYTSRNISI
jgi:hypothetical protein